MTVNKKQKLSFDSDQDQKIIVDSNPADSLFSEDMVSEENEGQLLLDVFADAKNLYIKSTIAGVKVKDIDISINNDMLTIRGTRSSEEEIEVVDHFFKECYWGSFSRSIILPMAVKSDKISATLKDGVLTITLPKADKQRNIPIKIKED